MAECEPAYQVVWPLGKSVSDAVAFSPRLPDLRGKTICELSDFDFGHWFPPLREVLRQQFPDLKFVEYTVFGATHGRNEREVIEALPDLLRRYGCDAVISGVGL